MSEKIWFWEMEGQRCGPESAEVLLKMKNEGAIQDSTLVWKEEMTDWAAFSTTELSEKETSPTPPALPPSMPKVENQEAASSETDVGQGILSPVTMGEAIPLRAAILRSDFHPRIRSCLGRAWDLLKADFWPYVGFFTLMIVLTSVASQLFIPIFFLMLPLMVGFSWYVLNRIRNRPASIDDLFVGFKQGFGDLALLNLVLFTPVIVITTLSTLAAVFGIAFLLDGAGQSDEALFIGVGLASLIGITILTVIFCTIYAVSNFASILVIDCGLKWKEALALGWKACKVRLGKMIVFYFVISIVSSLGLIALYVGVLVTSAWSMMAMTVLYEDAFGDEPV